MKTCVDTGKKATESKCFAQQQRLSHLQEALLLDITTLHQNLLYFVGDVIAQVFTTFCFEGQEKSVEAYIQNWKKRSEMGLMVQYNSKVTINFGKLRKNALASAQFTQN